MRLRRSDLDAPGIARGRRGRGFAYTLPDGSTVDTATRERCRALGIPPAWRDVWICPAPNGHIQATGVDDAGRRQYLYHPAWHERMAREKFDRMLDLADALPAARRGVTSDLRSEGFGRSRLLAGAFRMLDAAMLRVGSESYARMHGSIGLSTLLGRHAAVHAKRTVELRFPGKSGQHWESEVEDEDLAALITALKRRRGPDELLLAWADDAGTWHPLRSADINEDIRRRTGGDFTAKDFRTLHGTVVAARSLAAAGGSSSRSRRQRAIADATRAVSAALGNTVAVARSSYIDPRLFDAFADGATVDPSRQIEGQLRGLLAA